MNDEVLALFESEDFADVLKSITYKELVSETKVAGGVINATYNDHVGVKVLISSFSIEERRNDTIRNEDLKILAAAKGLAFAFNTKGTLVFDDGSEGKVVNAKMDPTESLWTLQVRK